MNFVDKDLEYRGGVQYHGGYHEYRGGYLEYCGGYSVPWGEYHDARGGYHEYCGGVQYLGGYNLLYIEYGRIS